MGISFFSSVKICVICGLRFSLLHSAKICVICGLLGWSICAAACSTFLFHSEHDFKYRWIGTDQWAAEHGSNVNVPPQLQDKKYEQYTFWGAFHTFDQLLPAQEYYKEHPEYYAMYEGRRVPNQLCTSNTDVHVLVAESVREVLRKNHEVTAITLGPEDNRFFCQCPFCKALDEPDPAPDQIHSRRLFLFYKRVSELVHEAFPYVIIRFGAYDTYAAPPKDKGLLLPPNTFPLVCHFQQYCNNHAIAAPSCEPNARFRQVIAGWQNLAGDLFVYEYYYKVNWLDLPWPMVHAVREDIPWYKEHGVKGFYSQYHPDSAASLLNARVAAALVLDVHVDVDQLVKDFCQEMFGPAQEEMRAYFVTLEEAMLSSDLHIPHNGFALHHAPEVFSDEAMKRCDRLLAHAQTKADHTPYQENVSKFVRLMEYANLCVDFLRTARGALVDKERDEGPAGEEEAAAKALEKGENLVAFLKENRARFQGVIPAPEEINPYMQYILDQLAETMETSSDS